MVAGLVLCEGRGRSFWARCASSLFPDALITGLAGLAAGLTGFLTKGLLSIE